MPNDVPTDYFVVQGDSPASIDAAVKVLRYHGLAGLMEAKDLGMAMAFGPGYNRAVRDNVDRAIWAMLRQKDQATAMYWVAQASAALKK